MNIDYAEAVVGFEFGNRMAVPVIQGVVIAEEHHDQVLEELEKDEAERARKEDEKKRKLVLTTWRKFLMGLRVADRIREDYAHLEEEDGVDGHAHHDKDWHAQMEEAADEMRFRDEDMGGGFLPEGFQVEEPKKPAPPPTRSNYFANSQGDEEDEADPFEIDHGTEGEEAHGGGFMLSEGGDDALDQLDEGGGGFMLGEDDNVKDALQEPEVEQLSSPKQGRRTLRFLKKATPKAKAKPKQSQKQTSRRRSRRTKVVDTEEEENSEQDDDDEFLLGDSE